MKALEIDDTLAEAHASLGLIKMYHDWDWSGAEREYKRAIELDPRSGQGYLRYGTYLQLMGRFDESIPSFKRALALDPLSLQANSLLGLALYVSRQYDKSVERYRKTLDMEPTYLPARFGLGLAYSQKGMYEEALVEFQKAGDLVDDLVEMVGELGYVYAASGKIGRAQEVLDELKERSETAYVSPYNMAKVYAGLAEKDLAFEWLEMAYEEKSEWLTWIKVDPKLDSIRSDPRFRDLMQRVGFETQ
jgi:tetratricopeptide (TPR) repeat protein